MAIKTKSQYKGFGFHPEEASHHFLVSLSKEIWISEHFEWNPEELHLKYDLDLGTEQKLLRVKLRQDQWLAIAEDTKAEFNRRLKAQGLPAGQWKSSGRVPLARQLGKELVLLAWAIETTEARHISQAIQNWRGLTPEERWWLFTMTNASSGQAQDSDKGWRKAVRFALAENFSPAKTSQARESFSVNWSMPGPPKRRKKQDASSENSGTLFDTIEGEENHD